MAEEKNFENRIKKFLKERGHWYIKFFANAMTKRGIPDILACINGRFVGIEVKAEKGVISELQIEQKKLIELSGGKSFIVRPSDFENFKKEVMKMEN